MNVDNGRRRRGVVLKAEEKDWETEVENLGGRRGEGGGEKEGEGEGLVAALT